MAVEVFPVSVVERPEPEVIEQGSRRGRRCPSDRYWYTDTHSAPRAGGRFKHEAQDIFAPSGSLVLAPEAGVIRGSSASSGPTPKGGHWLVLEVQNERGHATRSYFMSHLHEAPVVKSGDPVVAGEVLGLVGRTGNAVTTCPHLHIGATRWGRHDVGPGPGRRGGRAINLFEELQEVDPMVGGSLPPESESESRTAPTPTPTKPVETTADDGRRHLEVVDSGSSSPSPSSPSQPAESDEADAC